MREFRQGEDANAVKHDGREVKVRVEGGPIGDLYTVKFYDEYDNRVLIDQLQKVHASKLLGLKGSHFDIRGQVLTTSTSHPNEVGEIISIGTAKSGKKFFKVQFGDKVQEWFSEDHVFLDDDA